MTATAKLEVDLTQLLGRDTWNAQHACDRNSDITTLADKLDCYNDACEQTAPMLFEGVCYDSSYFVERTQVATPVELTLLQQTTQHQTKTRGEGFSWATLYDEDSNSYYIGHYSDTGSRGAEIDLGGICVWSGHEMPEEW